MFQNDRGDGYKGNPLIKPAGEKIEFTQEQIEEYLRCMQSPTHFIENHMKIVHVDRGLIGFDLYDYQKRIVNTIHENRYTICKLPRQSGKSSSVGGYLLHYALFNSEKKIAILANKEKTAKKLLADIKKAFEYLPKWLQQGVVEWNKTSITLENGSKITASATSADAIRGDSYSLVYLDEFAFVPEGQAEEFFMSVFPTISSGDTTKLVVTSTPKGLNHFYKMWVDAEEDRSGFVPIEIDWRETPGRDDEWMEAETAKWGQRFVDQEYRCLFFGSSNTLLNGPTLQALAHKTPIQSTDEGLDIYELPVHGKRYVLCADVGSGNEMDYSAFSVIDVSQSPYRVVAKYRSNTIAVLLYPKIIHQVAMSYNTAWVLIELNQDGSEVANSLYDDFEYENIINVKNHRGRRGQEATFDGYGKNVQLGVKQSAATKRVGCSILKDLMEAHKLELWDFDIINEFSTFVAKKKSYEAEGEKHDDLVMSLVCFGWLTSQKIFQEICSEDAKDSLYKERMKQQEDMMAPIGLFYDGINDEPEGFVDDDGQFWEVTDTDYTWGSGDHRW